MRAVLRLAQVELLGFKSFPHKTVVEIDPGVTCIVGPNGSGKSNIGDAIMFAFGSQSGHELRSQRTSGLIFAGTEQLRKLNLASVTLHFEVRDSSIAEDHGEFGGLPSFSDEEFDIPEAVVAATPVGSQLLEGGGWPGIGLTSHQPKHSQDLVDRTPAMIRLLEDLKPGDNVSVTRRVFRDGTGGYFINGEAVRLKDIDKFFNRYNLGRSSVFAMTQGEVEQKILSTPQEMRSWLAAATGVALFLQQKTRAKAKLHRTAQNLERLEDIRSNTRVLVEDLASQRELAEQHQSLGNQLRSVELNEIRREVEFSQRQQESSAQALTDLRDKLGGANAEFEAAKDAAQTVIRARKEADTGIVGVEETLEQARNLLAELRQRAAVAQRASASCSTALDQASVDKAELASQVAALDKELGKSDELQAQAKSEHAQSKETEQLAKAKLESAKEALGLVAREQENVTTLGFKLAQQISTQKGELELAATSKGQLGVQLESRTKSTTEARRKYEESHSELQAEREGAEQLALEAGMLRDQLESTEGQIRLVAKAVSQAQDNCTALKDELAQFGAKRKAITELVAQSEDQQRGAALLRSIDGLSALVSNAADITFPAGDRPAFARLLAHLGDALVVKRAELGKIKDALAGKAGEVFMLHSQSLPELHPQSLWRKAQAEAGVIAGLVGILGDVAVADTLVAAHTLLDGEPALSTVVLADGTALVGRNYALLGTPPPEQVMKVAQRSDLAEIDAQTQVYKTKLETTGAHLAEQKGKLSGLQWDRDDNSSKLASAEAKVSSALALGDRLHRSVEERQAELEQYELQVSQLKVEQELLAKRIPQIEQKLARLAQEAKENEQKADQVARDHLDTGAKLEDLRLEVSGCTTKRELAGQRLRHLEQAGLDLAERITNLRTRTGQIDGRMEAFMEEKASNEQTALDAQDSATRLEQAVATDNKSLAELKAQRAELGEQGEKQQQQLGALAGAAARLEQDLVSVQSQNERSTERIGEWIGELQQRFSLTFSQLLADAAITTGPPGLEFDVAGAGRGKLRDERARLSAELTALGPVNLLAIAQHQEHSARLEFLDTQATELEQAVAGLTQLVEDLDRNTEHQYRANLKKIETKFNEIYLRLFGSGWARLRFEDPEDLINTGVEIEVQLPAGRRHQLRSLSGGQRSLIFLALFFAVHNVRSPGFCILDEADAALDDANVQRFVKLIREYAQEEQFIIVTHNKATMETADKLIGVVGRPKGVSNLLEVNMKQARKMVG